MTRAWSSVFGVVALAVTMLTGCASAGQTIPSPDAPANEPPAEESVEEPALDLASDEVLLEICGIKEEALDSPIVTNVATADVPEYWTANFPPVPGNGHVYCAQTLTSNGLTNTWVYLDDSVEDFPIVEQWLAEVQAAGYPRFELGDLETLRLVANGGEVGTAVMQVAGDGKEYFAGVRAYGDSRLQIWIQPYP